MSSNGISRSISSKLTLSKGVLFDEPPTGSVSDVNDTAFRCACVEFSNKVCLEIRQYPHTSISQGLEYYFALSLRSWSPINKACNGAVLHMYCDWRKDFTSRSRSESLAPQVVPALDLPTKDAATPQGLQ